MNTIEMSPAIAALPREKHGRPIPWFVHVDDQTGVPDFRVIRRRGLIDAAMLRAPRSAWTASAGCRHTQTSKERAR